MWVLLSHSCLSSAADSTESEQLALALRQLDHIENTLERAEQGADSAPEARYFFDYRKAHRDIGIIRQGIQHYLIPARAQPRTPQELNAQFRLEHTSHE